MHAAPSEPRPRFGSPQALRLAAWRTVALGGVLSRAQRKEFVQRFKLHCTSSCLDYSYNVALFKDTEASLRALAGRGKTRPLFFKLLGFAGKTLGRKASLSPMASAIVAAIGNALAELAQGTLEAVPDTALLCVAAYAKALAGSTASVDKTVAQALCVTARAVLVPQPGADLLDAAQVALHLGLESCRARARRPACVRALIGLASALTARTQRSHFAHILEAIPSEQLFPPHAPPQPSGWPAPIRTLHALGEAIRAMHAAEATACAAAAGSSAVAIAFRAIPLYANAQIQFQLFEVASARNTPLSDAALFGEVLGEFAAPAPTGADNGLHRGEAPRAMDAGSTPRTDTISALTGFPIISAIFTAISNHSTKAVTPQLLMIFAHLGSARPELQDEVFSTVLRVFQSPLTSPQSKAAVVAAAQALTPPQRVCEAIDAFLQSCTDPTVPLRLSVATSQAIPGLMGRLPGERLLLYVRELTKRLHSLRRAADQSRGQDAQLNMKDMSRSFDFFFFALVAALESLDAHDGDSAESHWRELPPSFVSNLCFVVFRQYSGHRLGKEESPSHRRAALYAFVRLVPSLGRLSSLRPELGTYALQFAQSIASQELSENLSGASNLAPTSVAKLSPEHLFLLWVVFCLETLRVRGRFLSAPRGGLSRAFFSDELHRLFEVLAASRPLGPDARFGTDPSAKFSPLPEAVVRRSIVICIVDEVLLRARDILFDGARGGEDALGVVLTVLEQLILYSRCSDERGGVALALLGHVWSTFPALALTPQIHAVARSTIETVRACRERARSLRASNYRQVDISWAHCADLKRELFTKERPLLSNVSAEARAWLGGGSVPFIDEVRVELVDLQRPSGERRLELPEDLVCPPTAEQACAALERFAGDITAWFEAPQADPPPYLLDSVLALDRAVFLSPRAPVSMNAHAALFSFLEGTLEATGVSILAIPFVRQLMWRFVAATFEEFGVTFREGRVCMCERGRVSACAAAAVVTASFFQSVARVASVDSLCPARHLLYEASFLLLCSFLGDPLDLVSSARSMPGVLRNVSHCLQNIKFPEQPAMCLRARGRPECTLVPLAARWHMAYDDALVRIGEDLDGADTGDAYDAYASQFLLLGSPERHILERILTFSFVFLQPWVVSSEGIGGLKANARERRMISMDVETPWDLGECTPFPPVVLQAAARAASGADGHLPRDAYKYFMVRGPAHIGHMLSIPAAGGIVAHAPRMQKFAEYAPPLSAHMAAAAFHLVPEAAVRHLALASLRGAHEQGADLFPQIVQGLRKDCKKFGFFASSAIIELSSHSRSEAALCFFALRTEFEANGDSRGDVAEVKRFKAGAERAHGKREVARRLAIWPRGDDSEKLSVRAFALSSLLSLVFKSNRDATLTAVSCVDRFLELSSRLVDTPRGQRQAELDRMVARIDAAELESLPFDAHFRIQRILSTRVLKSHAKTPLMITFEGTLSAPDGASAPSAVPSGRAALGYIFKTRDEVRQDHLFLQVVRYVQSVAEAVSLPLYLRPYSVVSTRQRDGVMEVVTDSLSRDEIGGMVDGSLLAYLTRVHGPIGSAGFSHACRNFVASLVSYSVLTYVMHVKDRHNGNILVLRDGGLVHIDFGFILGIAPGGDLSIEAAPFKLTQEMIDVMGGSTASDEFALFARLCIAAFLVIRRRAHELIALVRAMEESGLQCFKFNTVERLRARLALQLDPPAAAAYMWMLIGKSTKKLRTSFYDAFQAWQNDINY